MLLLFLQKTSLVFGVVMTYSRIDSPCKAVGETVSQ